MQETQILFVGLEDPLEKEMATHSNILAWEILWTLAHQVPLFTGFFRQEYQSGLPFLSPGDLPDPGIEPGSPLLNADSLPAECGNHLGIGDNADCVSVGLGPGWLLCISNEHL